MAYVFGNVATFGLESASIAGGAVLFLPDQAVTAGTRFILSTREIEAPIALDGSGAFAVNLAPTDSTRPGTFYKIRIRVPIDGPGGEDGFTHTDFPDWRLYVPSGGGEIASLIAQSLATNAGMAAIGPEPPENAVAGTWWLNTNVDSLTYGRLHLAEEV